MPIRTLQEKFQHELCDVYDAEHHFLKAMEEMEAIATDPNLKAMIGRHCEQTQGHVLNLEQVFGLMDLPAQRMTCDGAKGIVSEGEKLMRETQGSPEVCDSAILDAAARAEHFEVATYRSLIASAKSLGQSQVVNLLHQNLEQEEQTVRLIEQAQPAVIQKALGVMTGLQATPTSTPIVGP